MDYRPVANSRTPVAGARHRRARRTFRSRLAVLRALARADRVVGWHLLQHAAARRGRRLRTWPMGAHWRVRRHHGPDLCRVHARADLLVRRLDPAQPSLPRPPRGLAAFDVCGPGWRAGLHPLPPVPRGHARHAIALPTLAGDLRPRRHARGLRLSPSQGARRRPAPVSSDAPAILVRPREVARDNGLPLHSGAERYYREAGYLR